MKIAIVTHYFWPELGAPTARLLELGRAWVAAGHEVTVVTNFPNHPSGVIPPEYGGRSFLDETVQGLRVLRCRTYATPNRGVALRTLGHIYFALNAVMQTRRLLRGSDIILASSPTLFAALAGWLLARRERAAFVFEVRDLWPAIFRDLGVIRNRVLLRLLEAFELFLYRRADLIVTVTQGFARVIAERGVSAGRLAVVPNGVDLEVFSPGPADEGVLAEPGLQGQFVLLYSGAHGISQGLARVLDAAELLRDVERVRFLFVGDGAEKEALMAQAKNRALLNVVFLPPVAREKMPALYRSASACLVPLRDIPLFRTFIPSKMFEVLGCGRPIVASLAGEAAEILKRSGAALVVPPEDAEALAAGVRRLAGDEGLCARLGAAGPGFVAAHYDRRRLADEYLELLQRVDRERSGG
jgi:glycosyltransferase involved in cell wall biosynthesis